MSPQATKTLVQGESFVICDHNGDILGRPVEGLFVGDTRVCSRLAFTIDREPVEPLADNSPSPFTATFVGRACGKSLAVFRHLWVGRGLRIDLGLMNHTLEPCRVKVRCHVGADFAGLFEVKEGRARGQLAEAVVDGDELLLGQRHQPRAALVRPHPRAVLSADGTLTWDVEVAPRGEWTCCLEFVALRNGEEVVPRHRCGQAATDAEPSARHQRWRAAIPHLDTDVPGLSGAFVRAREDLGALRIFDPSFPDEPVVAAGAPWFMTLFGRDSILTAWMALVFDPNLALSTARMLARLQGKSTVPETEEQPGKILHEIRSGEGSSLALGDGLLYYGTADATPLFVMLVAELWRWGLPLSELQTLCTAVDAALDWIAGPGDPDGDGYIEYERSTPTSLANQGWKDSWDSISFATGELAEAPIALAEVQAYAYAAWLAGAELARAAGQPDVAEHRHRRAVGLRQAFNRDFWLPNVEAYALALDADKRPVDSIGSNMGHCLWAGIVDPLRAPAVARWLTSPELYSGWGIRTLARSMARYDPLSYHNGSVWPHDTAICVAGLRRAGFADEAAMVGAALLRAAAGCDNRLPELFSGLGPEELGVPISYPASCSPQAWASAAPLLVLRSLLGLEPDLPEGTLKLDPVLPQGATRLRLEALHLGGSEVSIEAERNSVSVHGLPRGLAVIRPAANAIPFPL